MANFDSGVKGFITATATVEVKFPIDWRDNATSLSAWLAEIIENEIIPNKLKGDKNK